MRSRVFIGTLLGAGGGFLGYLLQERLVSHYAGVAPPLTDLMRLGTLVGLMLGIGLGAVEGIAVNSPRLLLWGALLGALVGAAGGLFGIVFGGQVFNAALFGKDADALAMSHNLLDFTHLVLARALGWTFLGAFPGLAAGAASAGSLPASSTRWLPPAVVLGFVGLAGWLLFWNRVLMTVFVFVAVLLFVVLVRANHKRVTHGLIGGLIGGFLGGIVFDLVATLITNPMQQVTAGGLPGIRTVEIGGPSRAIGITTIGALAGLFIGLVQEVLKQAWVRVLAGRNEGRDYIISKPLTVLGRDERADVPLFGDPALAPQHAAIRMEHGRHTLLDGGATVGSVVNGQRIQQPLLLKDGDMIQLGQVRLLFREKATASRVRHPAPDAQRAGISTSPVSVPATHCPFCGAPKDASGNCLCTVPGVGTGQAAPLQVGPPMPAGPAPGSAAPAPTWTGATAGLASAMGGVGSRLVALDGPYAGQVFPLAGPVVTVGRDPSHAISLSSDKTVSRSHARIAEQNGQHAVYDEGSSNGTYVNSVRVTSQVLVPGDVIQFGASKYRYE